MVIIYNLTPNAFYFTLALTGSRLWVVRAFRP